MNCIKNKILGINTLAIRLMTKGHNIHKYTILERINKEWIYDAPPII